MKIRGTLPLIAVLIAACCAYSNHFHNSFHFDDSHTIVDNAFIRDLSNIPRFFTDGSTFSNLPANRTYRPVVSTLVAICYRFGRLNTFSYHVVIFALYLTLLVVLYAFFRKIVPPIALLAVALFGLHPACAETVNYIIQSGDLIATLGVVAGLAIFVWFPQIRFTGLYLVPVLLGILAKPPALVFPLLLLAYLALFERTGIFRKALPGLLACAAGGLFLLRMKPATFNAGGVDSYRYWITQPYIAWHYFRTFFWPATLTADSDLSAFEGMTVPAIAGIGFVLALCAAAWISARRVDLRPISFGLIWFLIALIPAAVLPLAEVENDHRMFFPFIGLALATSCAAILVVPVRALVPAACGVLTVCAIGTWQRNAVWSTEETLWHDAALKSPRNGRALMNYGLTQMNKGEYQTALAYFERAAVYTPNYSLLEINRAIASGQVGDNTVAERHFQRAIALAPGDAPGHYYYGRWLHQKARATEAIRELRLAIECNSSDLTSRHLLLQVYDEQLAWSELHALAIDTLNLFPGDVLTQAYAGKSPQAEIERLEQSVRQNPTAEGYLNLSLYYHHASRYEETIAAARKALELRPNYAEAYNNVAAAYEAMQKWDEAIAAATQALRLKPDFELARNNLLWAQTQRQSRR